MNPKAKVLAVDDEPFNLDILTDYLEGDGYSVVGAEDGAVALQKLEENPDIDVIVMDRMMPHLNGIEVMERLKAKPEWRDIPVIMQTAAAASEHILQGINAGVYYYLTKPYEDVMLLSIVRAALENARGKKAMQEAVRQHRSVLGMMDMAHFRFRTMEEAKNLAYFISNCYPQPEKVVYGLSELMINAVEHGNLGITYVEKKNLVMQGNWTEEITARLAHADNQFKYAHLTFSISPDEVVVSIKDQGAGFDWQKYLEIAPDRATDPNGRGIYISKLMSFPDIEYIGNGNEVVCRTKI